MCPIVPTFTCGFVRSYFAFAIPHVLHPAPAARGLPPRGRPGLRHRGRDALGLPAVAALGIGPGGAPPPDARAAFGWGVPPDLGLDLGLSGIPPGPGPGRRPWP